MARVALNLRGIGREVLHRGMALVQAGRWTLTDLIDIRVTAQPGKPGQPGLDIPAALSGESAEFALSAVPALPGQACRSASPPIQPALPGQLPKSVTVHVGSARVVARVRPLGAGLARLSLADPLPLHVGDRVLLRDPGSRRNGSWPSLAGAVVLDVAPPPLAPPGCRRGGGATAV